ncbi:MAG TPA: hypothetical protein VKE74_15595 [Gemmataceae bacterium]|nr:hypothetical protein [Gemmataceae bacterium]
MTPHRTGLGFALVLALALTLRAADPKPEVRLARPTADGPAVVEVTGLSADALAKLKTAELAPAEWAAILRVVVAEGTPEDITGRPPVAGTYSVTADAIRFEPAFKLTPGVKYRATFAPSKLPGGDPKAIPITADLLIPKPPPGPPTSITAVYPSGNLLPENTLRLYAHFSGPMTRGDIYRHFKLVRDDGAEVKAPFLELDEELWSLDSTRVTIFFHPGRVKRGLRPREEEGPILEEGRRYTLVIERKWEDAEGRPLVAEFRKAFAAGPPDDQVVDPATWALVAPRAGSDSPLIVRLAKPLDRALLGSMVWVADATGERVAGTVTVGGGERVVTFAPAKPWARGEYRLVVDTRLEDACGNRVGQPFEVDVFHPIQRKIETKTVERRFAVR